MYFESTSLLFLCQLFSIGILFGISQGGVPCEIRGNMLQITQRRQEGTLIAVYTGELDHHAARAAIEQTEDLLVLFPCEKLVLDLSELTFMDSSGLAVVLHLYRTCARSGREFAVRGTPPQPMRVFEAAGLPQVMVFERGKE